MKFHATIVLEFTSHDIGDAGRRLNELLQEAEAHARDPVDRAFHAAWHAASNVGTSTSGGWAAGLV
jgi:hypothetical protein